MENNYLYSYIEKQKFYIIEIYIYDIIEYKIIINIHKEVDDASLHSPQAFSEDNLINSNSPHSFPHEFFIKEYSSVTSTKITS